MATTTISDVFQPEILTEAVQAQFGQSTAFMGSRMRNLGVVAISGTMPIQGAAKDAIGTTVKVPYWGTLGEFSSNTDGNAVSLSKISETYESATIARDSLAFDVTAWAQGNAAVNPNVGDPYEEAARQIQVAAERAMDKRLITAASNSGVYVKDVYSSSVPVTLNWDLVVDAKFEGWGDEQDDFACILTHSQAHKDLLKLKDGTGRPLLVQSMVNGQAVDTFVNVPLIVSDRVPVTSSTMSTVVASGTTPPTVTLAGTPLGAFKLQIDVVTGGSSNGTATFRFTTDNGNTWSSTYAIPNGGGAFVLDDSLTGAVADINSSHPSDSLVGVNGKTGITATFANGTYNADNLYTSNSQLKVMTMLLKKNALAFWYSAQHLNLQQFHSHLKDSDEAAMHLYGAAHRYRRRAGSTKSGVIQLAHNVSTYQ